MKNEKGNIVLISLLLLSGGLITFFSYRKAQKIRAISKAFIGQQEISGNLGFQSAEMQRLMEEVGWDPGDAWCVYYAKLVWYLSHPKFLQPAIMKYISGSSQKTWANVNNNNVFVVSKYPKVGDIVIWQTYKNGVGQSTGHAGIVERVGVQDFGTTEGNTNSSGGNEGYIVAEKNRTYDFTNNNGLRLKGFVRFA